MIISGDLSSPAIKQLVVQKNPNVLSFGTASPRPARAAMTRNREAARQAHAPCLRPHTLVSPSCNPLDGLRPRAAASPTPSDSERPWGDAPDSESLPGPTLVANPSRAPHRFACNVSYFPIPTCASCTRNVTRNPLAAHSDRDHKHTQAAPRCPSPKGWAHHGLNPTSRLTLRCVGIICPRVRLLVSLGEYPMQDCHSIVHNCIGKCILGN